MLSIKDLLNNLLPVRFNFAVACRKGPQIEFLVYEKWVGGGKTKSVHTWYN